jgi:hypothetical protein
MPAALLMHDYWPLAKQRRLRCLPATAMGYNERYGLVGAPYGIWASVLVMRASMMVRRRGRWRLERKQDKCNPK